MILFYDKTTGEIRGTIDGRVHSEEHLKMWIGNNTERIIITWKPVHTEYKVVEKKIVIDYKKDEEGFDQPVYKSIKQKVKTIKYEPDTSQKELITDISDGIKNINLYKINIKTGKLILKK